jgi:hypothetical protein
MIPINITDLRHYLACCKAFELKPSLGGWIAVELEGAEGPRAREYEAQCRAVWAANRALRNAP